LVLGIIILIIAGVFAILGGNGLFSKNTKVVSDAYVAVFLSNEQVYFGKMTEYTDTDLVLNDVYYLQLSGVPTPVAGVDKKTADPISGNTFSLIKLGNELHGPTDELFINRAHVLFYEKLRADGRVMQSITEDKNKLKTNN
jgi:hypothetical protein